MFQFKEIVDKATNVVRPKSQKKKVNNAQSKLLSWKEGGTETTLKPKVASIVVIKNIFDPQVLPLIEPYSISDLCF